MFIYVFTIMSCLMIGFTTGAEVGISMTKKQYQDLTGVEITQADTQWIEDR